MGTVKKGLLLVLASGLLGSLAASQQTGATRRIPQFENEEVRVWKSIIMPQQPLSMHRHGHPRAIIALAGGTLKIVKQSGESRSVVWETGKAYWLTADPPAELHGDVNEGNSPIEVMVVEIKGGNK
jgi:redox-sensitive bicupin YhaK (pirin superfamily)